MKLKLTFSKLPKIFILIFYLSGSAVYAQSNSLVVLGDGYPEKESIRASLPINLKVLEISQNDNLWFNLLTALNEDEEIDELHFFVKTSAKEIEVGNSKIGVEELNNEMRLSNLAALASPERQFDLFIYSCALAPNLEGKQFLNTLGDRTNFNVLSAANCASVFESDFNFDYSSKDQIRHTNLILD